MSDDPFGPQHSKVLANDLSVMAYHLQGLAERLSGVADYSDFDEAVLARVIRAAIAYNNPVLMTGLLHEIANALDKNDVEIKLRVVSSRAGNRERHNSRIKRLQRDFEISVYVWDAYCKERRMKPAIHDAEIEFQLSYTTIYAALRGIRAVHRGEDHSYGLLAGEEDFVRSLYHPEWGADVRSRFDEFRNWLNDFGGEAPDKEL